MRRYKQDKENAALLQGVYLGVHDQNKTQVRHSIATYIRISQLKTKQVTVKMRRYKQFKACEAFRRERT